MKSDRASWVKVARFRWPLFLALNGALLLIVWVSAGRETYQQWKVDEEIGDLQQQVNQLEGKRLTLLDTLQKLNALETLDREARLRLDLKKPGERVVVLKGFDVTSVDSAAEALTPSAEPSNPLKWFRYFFVHNKL